MTSRLGGAFHWDDRERGAVYYAQGRVALVGFEDRLAVARVRGTREYLVSVSGWAVPETGVLRVDCDCPRFADGVLCKHVWATLLALDSEGESESIAGTGPVTIQVDTFEDDELDLDLDDFGAPLSPAPTVRHDVVPVRRKSGAAPGSEWESQLHGLAHALAHSRAARPQKRPESQREVRFRIDVAATFATGELTIDFLQRQRKKDRAWGKTKILNVSTEGLESYPEGQDRSLLQFLVVLAAQRPRDSWAHRYWGRDPRRVKRSRTEVPEAMYDFLLPRLATTGRFEWGNRPGDPGASENVRWDDGPPWKLVLRVTEEPSERELRLSGVLRRGDEERPLSDPVLLLASGLVLFRDHLARLDSGPHFPWIALLRGASTITVPIQDAPSLVEHLWSLPDLPAIELPSDLALEEVRIQPRPQVRFRSRGRGALDLLAEVLFDYSGNFIAAHDERRGLVKGRSVIVRDLSREKAHLELLAEVGLRPHIEGALGNSDFLSLAPGRLPQVTKRLLSEGWIVEAEGLRMRTPSASRFRVSSGIDWLELEGELDFEGEIVAIPAVLEALERGERFVRLSDGSQGMLPEEWLERTGALTGLAPKRVGDHLRFRSSQALLLDALLDSARDVRVDDAFAKLRERLRSFEGIEPARDPAGFRGALRGYQREGLAWLGFLARFGFGGCLADDMGLGKTIQVLALFQEQRANGKRRDKKKPSLVVVPRSLVHNWLEEAARFVPGLRFVDYSGNDRAERVEEIEKADAAVTTYGILRRDFLVLKEIDFEYVVLDEAQAIKNEGSQAAKASRLLRADHRLALTGTPVENHLGELWSLFQFLNPGMLGKLGRAGSRNHSPAGDAGLLARALRPFILRRTKAQVLPDLPPKNEQTIFCVLEDRQRKLYEELRRHYQRSLRGSIEKMGFERAKFQVLEALLRLRQAACHPALLERSGGDESSAKLDVLLPQIEQVVAEGHKAIVFSQFTSFLAIVKREMDRRGLVHEYLDGRTRDRKRRVDRFQTDPDCRIFLVSLKAGGVGLNLTAADYVYILDPWWNPAVETQAIDRTHRIGQTRPVFAYRLIAEDTVEEKILVLQEQKRDLANAILSADERLVRNLTAKDLELLLS